MIQIDISYEGDLRCSLRHNASGVTIQTDAPADNFGKGESFSPTDLCAASLASCMATTMGIAARKNNFLLDPFALSVQKIMTATPTRRIAKLPVTITLGREYSPEQLAVLEHAALTCPVKESLSTHIEISIAWIPPAV